jgi:hypothetical protein
MTRLRKLLLYFATLPLLMAQQPDYFPLHLGNQWVYRQFGSIARDPLVVSISRTETANGRTYSVVRGLPDGDLYLRMAEDGTLYAYNPETGQEGVWAAFMTPEGQSYRTIVNPCNSTAVVASRNARTTVPIGELTGVLAITYPAGNCADAGLATDRFLPYIGLVERESITIAGPQYLRLIYARVGGVTVLSEPEVTFSLTLDRPQYGGEEIPAMTARLALRSTQSEPLELTFPSGQRFDLVVRNEAGVEVIRWSEGKAFTLAFGTERFGPGERNWVVRIPLSSGNARLPAGRYIAETWLTTEGPRRIYVASVGFEVLPPR